MKNDQNFKVNMSSFVLIIDMAISFVLFAYFHWNFILAVALSSLIGELFIRNTLIRETTNAENVPKLIAIANREWWVCVVLSIAPVLYVLIMIGARLTFVDHFWGASVIVLALAKAGWIDWNHNRKLRAVLLLLSCISWALFPFTFIRETILTAILLRVSLGFTAIAFLWSLADSLLENKIKGGIVTVNRDIDDEEDEAGILDLNKIPKKEPKTIEITHSKATDYQVGNSSESATHTVDSSSNQQRKSTLRTDLIVMCPKCKMRVLPKTDGTCPSCQAKILK